MMWVNSGCPKVQGRLDSVLFHPGPYFECLTSSYPVRMSVMGKCSFSQKVVTVA